MTTTENIHIREACPICASTATVSLLRIPFTSAPISDYFIAHYEGRADFTRLGASEYSVEQCKQCEFISICKVKTPAFQAGRFISIFRG